MNKAYIAILAAITAGAIKKNGSENNNNNKKMEEALIKFYHQNKEFVEDVFIVFDDGTRKSHNSFEEYYLNKGQDHCDYLRNASKEIRIIIKTKTHEPISDIAKSNTSKAFYIKNIGKTPEDFIEIVTPLANNIGLHAESIGIVPPTSNPTTYSSFSAKTGKLSPKLLIEQALEQEIKKQEKRASEYEEIVHNNTKDKHIGMKFYYPNKYQIPNPLFFSYSQPSLNHLIETSKMQHPSYALSWEHPGTQYGLFTCIFNPNVIIESAFGSNPSSGMYSSDAITFTNEEKTNMNMFSSIENLTGPIIVPENILKLDDRSLFMRHGYKHPKKKFISRYYYEKNQNQKYISFVKRILSHSYLNMFPNIKDAYGIESMNDLILLTYVKYVLREIDRKYRLCTLTKEDYDKLLKISRVDEIINNHFKENEGEILHGAQDLYLEGKFFPNKSLSIDAIELIMTPSLESLKMFYEQICEDIRINNIMGSSYYEYSKEEYAKALDEHAKQIQNAMKHPELSKKIRFYTVKSFDDFYLDTNKSNYNLQMDVSDMIFQLKKILHNDPSLLLNVDYEYPYSYF